MERIPEPKHPFIEHLYIQRWQNRDGLYDLLYESLANHVALLDSSRCTRPGLIVDAACGDGISSHAFAKVFRYHTVIGTDICAKGIALARENYGERSERLRFEQRDVHDLNGYEADIVTCISALHEFDHVDQALSEIYRILKPGGLFWFTDLNRDDLQGLSPRAFALDDGGVSPVGRRFYAIRKKLSDEEFIDLLQDEERLNGIFGEWTLIHNQWECMRFASVAAAYTPTEIEEKIKAAGFQELHWMDPTGYEGYAIK